MQFFDIDDPRFARRIMLFLVGFLGACWVVMMCSGCATVEGAASDITAVSRALREVDR